MSLGRLLVSRIFLIVKIDDFWIEFIVMSLLSSLSRTVNALKGHVCDTPPARADRRGKCPVQTGYMVEGMLCAPG